MAAPYLGEIYTSDLQDAVSGNEGAQQSLIQSHLDNPVVHLNLRYLFSVDSQALVRHLKTLLERWFDELLSSDMASTMVALQLDEKHKKQLADNIQPTDLIRMVCSVIFSFQKTG